MDGYEYIKKLTKLELIVQTLEVDSSFDHFTFAEAALNLEVSVDDIRQMVEDSEVLSEVVAVACNGGIFDITREANYGIEY